MAKALIVNTTNTAEPVERTSTSAGGTVALAVAALLKGTSAPPRRVNLPVRIDPALLHRLDKFVHTAKDLGATQINRASVTTAALESFLDAAEQELPH